MAESRVEKFREYRKSIISDGSPVSKTTIDTTLNIVGTNNSEADFSEQFEIYRKIKVKNACCYVFVSLIILTILILLIVYGIKLF